MYRKIHLDIDFKPFMQIDLPEASTCIKHQATECRDVHEKYGGLPKSYVFENTKIHQKFWTEDQVDFEMLNDKLGIEAVTVSSIMQPPGNVIPLHRDTFFQVKKRFPDDKRKIVRYNIYMQDWKIGHFLQHDDNICTHWKQGDGHMWDGEVLHIGANAGMEDKYTLQVSGFLNDKRKN